MFGESDILSQGGCYKNVLMKITDLIFVLCKVEKFLMYDSNHKRSRPLEDWGCSCTGPGNTINTKEDVKIPPWEGAKKRARFKE